MKLKNHNNLHRSLSSQKFLGYLFTLPALIFMLSFIGYPIIQNILLSFQNIDVYTFAQPDMQKYIGLENYIDLFTKPGAVLPGAIIQSLIFTVGSIFFQFIIGFGLALLFRHDFPGSTFFRGVSMISWLIPVTVTGLLFKFMFGVNGGIINQILRSLNLIQQPVQWLLQPHTAMMAIIIANIWIGIPFNMILILTGLTTVPDDIYESASIDGANPIQKLFKITIPMIKPAIMSVLTLGFVYTFKVFDLVWVMTKGGPVNATDLVSTFSYKLSFDEFKYSQGAAAANVMFVILLIVGSFYTKVIKDDEVM